MSVQAQTAAQWPNYGRDAGGSRFSPLALIDTANVSALTVAWTFQTGELGTRVERGSPPSLEVTPIVVDGVMYISTPLGRVIALDPGTGAVRWRYDAQVNINAGYGDFTSRGVSTYLDPAAAPGGACRRRIFVATIDARLIALDALTGVPCERFGRDGEVDLRRRLRIAPFEFQAYQQTSPPLVIGDLVVVGSSIADNSRANPASGEVRAFDARTGALRWTWYPIPQDDEAMQERSWRGGSARRTGGANAWSVLVADVARGLIFVPTSSPAPDYYGGLRPGDNRYANSIVALRARTGEVAWHFQTVHHDLWDYDNASPPALAEVVRENGARVPVVLQATKTGMLFVLHRETGDAVFPVEERPVPPSSISTEEAWPTQPFTVRTPPLSPHRRTAADAWGINEEDRSFCENALRALDGGTIFSPPSRRGTLVTPSNIGGAHWGGVAVDALNDLAIVPVNELIADVQLIPDREFDADAAREISSRTGDQFTRMRGTGYVMRRSILRAPSGLPCSPPPFGSLVAVSLRDGNIAWKVPLGTLRLPDGNLGPAEWGSPNLGGAIVTAGGLVFIGASADRSFRAFDSRSGRELWRGDVPAGAKATPMTYSHGGKQYVVIAAGGGGFWGEADSIVAFALPDSTAITPPSP
ncbi:MAG: pyrroloquinoline quinone-dependent dehydrogenase [Gemmatimonadaceae bacterium]|nr:pyrroloquinoline quinone-dependent dehydrogenase [Gemmatimonadaceae bacterium]